MALYMVSYDIAERDKSEYPQLWETLKRLGATKILYSEWVIVDQEGQSTSIYEEISPCIRQTDRLLVQELGADATWDKLLISADAFQNLLVNARS